MVDKALRYGSHGLISQIVHHFALSPLLILIVTLNIGCPSMEGRLYGANHLSILKKASGGALNVIQQSLKPCLLLVFQVFLALTQKSMLPGLIHCPAHSTFNEEPIVPKNPAVAQRVFACQPQDRYVKK